MKKVILNIVLAVMSVFGYAQTQTNLAGREYHCANIMAGEFKDIVAKAKEKTIKEKEKKLGRKLTDAEQKQLDSEMKKNQADLKAMEEGTKMSMTLNFKSTTEMIMMAKMTMSDKAMKAAGIGWLKRKAIKAAMAMMPSVDVKYTIKNNLLFYTDEDGEKDTLRISPDGKYIYGTYRDKDKNKNYKYTLTRTK